MAKKRKRQFTFKRGAGSRRAHPLTVSMYPEHEDILRFREREFNVSRSSLLGLLLEIEQREGLLRPELVRRLRSKSWAEINHTTV
jgi:hypothetical protein